MKKKSFFMFALFQNNECLVSITNPAQTLSSAYAEKRALFNHRYATTPTMKFFGLC